jgi:hypothetical protein
MINNIKVCMLIPSFHPLVGGAETQLENLADYLNKAGLYTWILTRKLPDTRSIEIINNVKIVRLRSIK